LIGVQVHRAVTTEAVTHRSASLNKAITGVNNSLP
jgi:hypothetical protein